MASVGAARSISCCTRAIAGDVPSNGVSPAGAAAIIATLSFCATALRDARSAAAVRTVASSRSFDQGLVTKSVAPRFIASIATCTPAWAVIITITACGSRARKRPSHSNPSAALVAPREKLASSRIASGVRPAVAAKADSGSRKVSTSPKIARSNRRAASNMSSSSSMTTHSSNGFSCVIRPSVIRSLPYSACPEPCNQYPCQTRHGPHPVPHMPVKRELARRLRSIGQRACAPSPDGD